MKRHPLILLHLALILLLLAGCAERQDAVMNGTGDVLIYLGQTPVRGVANDVAAADGYAYVADEPYGITVYDISDPANPVQVDSLELNILFPDDVDLISVDPYGRIAIVEEPPSTNAYNLQTGQLLFPVGSSGHFDVDLFFMQGETVDSLTILRCDQNQDDGFNFEIYLNPLGTYSLPFSTQYIEPEDFELHGFAWDFGDIVYLCRDTGGIVALDCSTPVSATVISELNLAGKVRDAALWMATFGDVLCLAAGYEGLITVDVSDPANMVELASFRIENANDIERVELYGNYALLMDRFDGIFAVDISDPANPVLAGHLETSNPNNFCLYGSTILVADEDQGLVIGDIPVVINLVPAN
jgi:hypothetical protein